MQRQSVVPHRRPKNNLPSLIRPTGYWTDECLLPQGAGIRRAWPPHARRSDVVEPPRLGGEMVAVIRMSDGDQRPRPLTDRAAAQLGDAPFGHDLVDGVLEGGDDVAGGQLGDDLAGAMAGRRVQNDETLTAVRIHRAAREVCLATAGRVVGAGDGLGCALTEQVDGDRRIDGDEALLLSDDTRVI